MSTDTILKDEDVLLCKAHIVNKAPGSSRAWTVQRTDVDNFYGAESESDFVDLKYLQTNLIAEVFFDRTLHGRMRPKILCDDREVNYFFPKGPVPKPCAALELKRGDRTVQLALKRSPAEFLSKCNSLRFEVRKDLRLPTVVSVLKAAHLTLFEMLGYAYALSPGGQFLGRQLGEFFLLNAGRPRNEAVQTALTFFAPLSMLVRPLAATSPKPSGSIDGRSFRVCWCEGRANMWGIIVFVRAHKMVHACLVPVFSDDQGLERFGRFLGSTVGTLETSIAHFNKDHWDIDGQRTPDMAGSQLRRDGF